MARVELGCGLLALGREWGTTPQVPSESDAQRFLEAAYNAGIRFFDTAPAYSLSERRLGAFLRNLTPEQRARVTVATKFGEHWDVEDQKPYADHSADALKRSIDRSVELLGAISIIQLHKPSAAVLESDDFAEALEHANSHDIPLIGVSASDPVMARAVTLDARFSAIQMPCGDAFRGLPRFAYTSGLVVIVNRPFGMGQAVAESTDRQMAAVTAFKSVLSENFGGVVLTGTSNPDHLAQNIAAFNQAVEGN